MRQAGSRINFWRVAVVALAAGSAVGAQTWAARAQGGAGGASEAGRAVAVARARSVRAAADPRGPLTVATREIRPFVFSDGGQLRGFSVELWKAIALKLGRPTSFSVQPNVTSLLNEVQNGKAQVGIAAISVTAGRERAFDFSQPMFDAGLQILVPQGGGGGSPQILQMLNTPAMKSILILLPFLIIIPAHMIYLIEKRRDSDFLDDKRYLPGIGKSIWWAAGVLGAQADEMPKSPWGRVIAIGMMFGGVLFVAFFTAAATTSLTVQQLRGDIKGPEDLPGKQVATTQGSTSADFLREVKARPILTSTIDEAFQALEKKQVQAVVFDAPVVLYYASHDGAGTTQVAGSVFRREDYGIVFPTNSPLRKQVNEALLSLREDGTYQEIYDRWFKAPDDGS